MSDEIINLEKIIRSLQKSYDDETYTGKYSDLLCDITMKKIRLDELKEELNKWT